MKISFTVCVAAIILSTALFSCSTKNIPRLNFTDKNDEISQVDDTTSVNMVTTEEITTEDTTFSITLNFMGDCTLGTQLGANTEGRFNHMANNVFPTYFFEGVKAILDEGTFNITNCEGVLTDNPLTEKFKDYSPAFWFKSSSQNAKIFSENNIHIVSIANNHINDYNDSGRLDTISALEENNVLWSDNTKTVILEENGIRICIFCVTLWDNSAPNQICQNIIDASDSTDLQIVFFHGGTENIHQPDYYKVDYAHAFVDAGADLVVGSHPHVLQPLEKYNGVNIIYSLGNFIYGGHMTPENRTIVYQHNFTFERNLLINSSEEIFPCYIYTGSQNEFQPTIIEDENDKQQVLDFMYGNADTPF